MPSTKPPHEKPTVAIPKKSAVTITTKTNKSAVKTPKVKATTGKQKVSATPANEAPVRATAVVDKIKTIKVLFSKAVPDANKRVMTVGTATATYNSGAVLSVPVSGGANVKTYGITDPVKSLAIFRIEKSTYKNHNGDAMPYALFYHGGEALHVGRLDKISHGCVHIADQVKMKKLNLDVVKNKTAVTVAYAAGVLDKVMKQKL